MDPNLRNSIIVALGLKPENMTEVQMTDVVDRVGTLIYQGVLQKIMERLPDEDVDQFGKLLDDGVEPEKITEYLKSKVPDFEELIKLEAQHFIEESADIMGQI